MLAIGRPGLVKLSMPSGRITDSFSPRIDTCSSTSAGSSIVMNSCRRRHRFDAAGAGAAADPIEQILLGPELALDHRPIDQRVVHRQHANGRGVFAVGLLQLHQLGRIGVAVVQLERHRDGAAMRRNGDEHAFLGVGAGQHIAEAPRRSATPTPSSDEHFTSA